MRKKSKNGKLFSFLPHSSSIAQSVLVMDSPYLSQPPVTDNTFPWESVIRGDAGYLAVHCPATYFADRGSYIASRAYISARTSIFRTIGGPLSRKSHYSPSKVIAREALLKKLRPWSALSLVRVKRSHGALIRRLVRTGSSPASRYSVVN